MLANQNNTDHEKRIENFIKLKVIKKTLFCLNYQNVVTPLSLSQRCIRKIENKSKKTLAFTTCLIQSRSRRSPILRILADPDPKVSWHCTWGPSQLGFGSESLLTLYLRTQSVGFWIRKSRDTVPEDPVRWVLEDDSESVVPGEGGVAHG